MKAFEIYRTVYTTDNTPEYGHGDYSDSEEKLILRVKAETKRKAMNKAKKIDPRIMFGGAFGDTIREVSEDG